MPDNTNFAAREKITIQPGSNIRPGENNGSHVPTNLSIDESLVFPADPGNSFAIDPYTRDLDKSLAVGTVPGTASVSLQGTANYNIPINLPSGGNLTPSLALVYNSAGGNSQLGMGWNLSGLSAISVTGKSHYFDNKITPVDFMYSNEYNLDGVRLLKVGPNEYRTESESFCKITLIGSPLSPDGFIAEHKSGQKYEYGLRNGAVFSNGPDGTHRLMWRVSKISDKYGNYVEFAYENGGESRITEIKYTGNSTLDQKPYNTVTFLYDERVDKDEKFVAGYGIQNIYLLNAIKIRSEGRLVSEYKLRYEYGEHSLLTSVELYNGEGEKVNPTCFSYGKRVDVLTEYEKNITFQGEESVAGDYNGDGMDDILKLKYEYRYPTYQKYHIGYQLLTNKGQQYESSDYYTLPDGSIIFDGKDPMYLGNKSFSSADFNGDGVADFLMVGVSTNSEGKNAYINFIKIYYGRPKGSDAPAFIEQTVEFVDAYLFNRSNFLSIGDFDGDGASDFMIIASNELSLYPHDYKQTFFFPHLEKRLPGNLPWAFLATAHVNAVMDFDGDGKQEILSVSSTVNQALIFTFEVQENLVDADEIYDQGFPTKYHHLRFGDFNSDGKTDILNRVDNQARWNIQYSTGVGFIGENIDLVEPDNDNVYVADFNGDGFSDILRMVQGNATIFVLHYYTGFQRFSEARYTAEHEVSPAGLTLGDFSGTGQIEALHHTIYYHGFLKFSECRDENLMLVARNGYNFTQQFSYIPLASYEKYSRVFDVTYPNPTVSFPIKVVARFTEDNGIGGLTLQDYSYKNARLNKLGRGFLGFEKVECLTEFASNPDKTRAITTFEIDPVYYYPRLKRNEVFAGESLSLVSKTEYHYAGFDLGSKRHFEYPDEVIKTDYLNGNTVVESQVINLDGNLVSATQSINDGAQMKVTSYSDYLSAGSWMTNVPQRVTETSYRDGQQHSFETYFEYNLPTGSLTKTVKFNNLPQKVTEEFIYTEHGNLQVRTLSAADEDSRSVTYTYDPKGRAVVSETNSLGHTSAIEYDFHLGKPMQMTDPNGLTSKVTYDNWGRETIRTSPESKSVITEYLWGSGNNRNLWQIKTSGEGLPHTVSDYDLLGRVTKTITENFAGDEVKSEQFYDAKGQVYEQSGPHFNELDKLITTYGYDAFGRKKSSQTAGLSEISYAYDLRKTTVTTPIATSSTEVDASGLLADAHDGIGQVEYTEYSALGQPKTIAAPGKVITIQYDDYGLQWKLNDPDAGTCEYLYNAFGELTYQKDAKGNIVSDIRYDRLGRILSKKEFDAETGVTATYSYAYDGVNGIGNLFKVERNHPVEGVHSTEYVFDELGRVQKEKEVIKGQTYITSYKYDDFGRLLEKRYSSGLLITYIYNSRGALVEIRNSSGQPIWKLEEENARGQITKYTLGNGKTTQMTYNSYGLPAGQETPGVNKWYYEWDNDRAQLVVRRNELNGLWERFYYNQDRLQIAFFMGTTPTSAVSYDPQGTSRIDRKTDVGFYKYGGPRPNAVYTIEYPTSAIAEHIQNITYNAFNSVSTISENQNQLSIHYGHHGQRVYSKMEKPGSVTSTVYLGDVEIQESGSGKRTFHYLSGPSGLFAIVIKENETFQTYYVYQDYLGSIQEITNETGGVVGKMCFDAWGRRRDPDTWVAYQGIPVSMPLGLARGYTMHEHLPEFGLINMNGRMYDPVLGLMLSPDNFVSDATSTIAFNRYLYANGNPLKYVDPDGEMVWFLPAIIGAAVGIITNGIENSLNGEAFFAGAGRAALIGAISGVVSFGIGSASATMTGIVKATFQTVSHGYMGGLISAFSGGSFESGFLSGAAGSLMGAGTSHLLQNAGSLVQTGGTVLAGGVSGGFASELGGGKFWDGFRTGVITTGLNHIAHQAFYDAQLKKMYDVYKKSVEEYPNAAEFYESLGGPLGKWAAESPEQFENTCAARLSKALNYGGFEIPKGTPGTYLGGDGKSYFVNAKAMTKYLSLPKMWGRPSMARSYSNVRNAVISQTGFGGGVTGHLDIIYRGVPANHVYRTATYYWH